MSFELSSDGALWAWVALGLLVALAVPLSLLMRLIRQDHLQLYQELGSPRWFGGGFRGAWLFMRFLFSSRPRESGDTRLRALCRIIRPLYVVAMVWVLLPFVTILAFALFGQR